MVVLVRRDTPQYCVMVTLEDWPRQVTRTVAREIRRHRDGKMSAQQLADRTGELGMEIPRSVLANLESGRRETVTVPELLILAAALQVAPTELICPVGYDEQIEILPGRMMDPLSASRWVDGELVLELTATKTSLRPPAAGEESSTRLLEQHAGLVEEVEVHDAEADRAAADLAGISAGVDLAASLLRQAAEDGSSAEFINKLQDEEKTALATRERAAAELAYKRSAAARYREAAGQSLRYIRADMRRRGMLLPALPQSLALEEEPGPEEGEAS